MDHENSKKNAPLKVPSLRKVVLQIVDDLHPLLPPIECALYWYLFAHAEVTGARRVAKGSRRAMQAAVAATAYRKRGGKLLAYSTVQQHLQALERFGAIRRLHDRSNRGGTAYRVFLPYEIKACCTFRKERSASQQKANGKDDDFYNNPKNRRKIFERDQMRCQYCRRKLTTDTATIDHVNPVSSRRDHGYNNVVTACGLCNSSKNNRSAATFLRGAGSRLRSKHIGIAATRNDARTRK